MTVQEICKLLRENKIAVGEFALTGSGFPASAVPEDVLDVAFLADSVLKINDVLKNRGLAEDTAQTDTSGERANFSSEGELTAQLQANAFLASYQKAAGTRKKRRLDRLASKYTRTIVNGRPYGPLAGQLNDIGVKVDADFAAFIIPEEEEQ